MSHVMVMRLADKRYSSESGNKKRVCELVSSTLVASVLR